MNTLQLLGSVELGLIYGLVAMGVYLTFRVVDFPDLTVDGSFPLGAAVCTTLLCDGHSPLFSILFAVGAGAIAGLITGVLHVRFRILGLLAGILTMTALYSINLRIMGRPNVALLDIPTIFNRGSVLTIMLGIVLAVGALLIRLMASQFGLSMRAVGMNHAFSRANGVSVGRITLFTLALSNGLVALGGALFAQSQGFADISMGTGTVVVGLASVIIGEAIMPTRSVGWALIATVLGSILYRIVIALALNCSDFGLQASDLNLVTALLVTLTMVAPKLRKIASRERAS